MKTWKKVLIISISCILVVIAVGAWMVWDGYYVSTFGFGGAELVCKYQGEYGSRDIKVKLTEEEAETIKDLFHGKRNEYELRCGYDENIAIVFDGEVFCIALDSAHSIYYKNEDKYFGFCEEECAKLLEILEKYDFSTPHMDYSAKD